MLDLSIQSGTRHLRWAHVQVARTERVCAAQGTMLKRVSATTAYNGFWMVGGHVTCIGSIIRGRLQFGSLAAHRTSGNPGGIAREAADSFRVPRAARPWFEPDSGLHPIPSRSRWRRAP